MLLSQEVDGGMSRVQEVVQMRVGVMTECQMFWLHECMDE